MTVLTIWVSLAYGPAAWTLDVGAGTVIEANLPINLDGIARYGEATAGEKADFCGYYVARLLSHALGMWG